MNPHDKPASKTEYAVEGNGWVIVDRPMPCLKDQSLRALLSLSTKLPGRVPLHSQAHTGRKSGPSTGRDTQ